jgi:hypothetical protein
MNETNPADGAAFLDHYTADRRLEVVVLARKDQLIERPAGESVAGKLRSRLGQAKPFAGRF